MNPQLSNPYGQMPASWPQSNGNPQAITSQMADMNLGPGKSLPTQQYPPSGQQPFQNGPQMNLNNNRPPSSFNGQQTADSNMNNNMQQMQRPAMPLPNLNQAMSFNYGMRPTQPGQMPQQSSGQMPQQQGQRPMLSEQMPGQIGQRMPQTVPPPGQMIHPQPAQMGQRMPQTVPPPGQMNPGQISSSQPGQISSSHPGQMMPQQPGQMMPQQPGQISSSQPGQISSSQSGQISSSQSAQMMPQQPGQMMPQQPGQMIPQQPGQMMPPQPGQMMPPQPGQMMPPQPGQMMPPQPGQMMPPQPGQMMPPQPSQMMPPQPAQMMSPQPGQVPYIPPLSQTYQGSLPQQQQYNQMQRPSQYTQQPTFPQPQPPQQQRRLDPDHMPNPIQVISENQRSCGGIFQTNQVGLVPPLVTSDFLTEDQGNTGPRFMRSSMYSVPATADMMKQSAVPFSLIISPMAKTLEKEMKIPIVDFGELGPIRCIRCKAYMSPYMQFIDAGRRFQCLLCKATTAVPPEYFQHLDHTGQRVDKYERPELILGTYEFVATKDYCRENTPPKPPAIVFVIDVSYNNVKSGLVSLLCSEIKNIVKKLPIDEGQTRSTMKVGFITYNNTVHFYNIKNTLAQPQMMVVGDLQEMFMPLLDGFLCDPEESADIIDSLMEQIPKMFGDTRETETILLPALQGGFEALKASGCAGKLLVFHSSLPIAEAPGKLKNRDDRKALGTEKEKTVLSPQNTSYNMLGQDCVGAGVSVDLFIFNNSYIDLATMGQVSRLTGGEIYKYTYFQADIDGERLIHDLVKNVQRPIAFDAVMRVRTSTGIRPTDFYGHFFMSNTTDMEIASIDCDKSIAIEIKHDDKLPPEENVYIQVALLYTSCGGQRRLRVLNLSLKTCTQLADLFRSCDLDTTILFFAKQGLFKLLENTPKAIKDGLISRAAQILACYRKHCASPTSAGQLILPECMKLLPLYVSCLLKNDAFSGGPDITLDDRSFVMYFVMTMDLPTSVQYFYPRLIPIHDVEVDENGVPAAIRCTADKMQEHGVYILENGIHMFMWIGSNIAQEFTQSVFGVQAVHQIDTERCRLPVFDNKLSHRIRGIIDSIQNEKNRCMRLTLVKQRDKLENVLRHFLVEDRGVTDGSASYVDFLCHMHKEIRQLIS